jgi:hypothetical protein
MVWRLSMILGCSGLRAMGKTASVRCGDNEYWLVMVRFFTPPFRSLSPFTLSFTFTSRLSTLATLVIVFTPDQEPWKTYIWTRHQHQQVSTWTRL